MPTTWPIWRGRWVNLSIELKKRYANPIKPFLCYLANIVCYEKAYYLQTNLRDFRVHYEWSSILTAPYPHKEMKEMASWNPTMTLGSEYLQINVSVDTLTEPWKNSMARIQSLYQSPLLRAITQIPELLRKFSGISSLLEFANHSYKFYCTKAKDPRGGKNIHFRPNTVYVFLTTV